MQTNEIELYKKSMNLMGFVCLSTKHIEKALEAFRNLRDAS